MNTKLSELKNQFSVLDEIASSNTGLLTGTESSFLQSFEMAVAIKDMRAALTKEVMAPIMALMNTPLGFRTDQDPKSNSQARPYGEDVVKEAIIEASMRGIPAVGNCLNIIAGRFYCTKEGFQFLLRNKVPGLTNLKTTFEVPRMRDGGAIVTAKATWKLNGEAMSLTREIPVRVNKAMGTDAVIGKATRKLLAAVHSEVTGSDIVEGDAIEVSAEVVPSNSSSNETEVVPGPNSKSGKETASE